ncbi:MAG: MFS transporter [Pseudomonadales bacterium]
MADPNAPESYPTRWWTLLGYRDYRLLWVALLGSSLVSWLRIFATSQWLLEATGSPAIVGSIGVVQLIVQTPATLWGGTLADRVDRKRLLVASNATVCAVLFTVGLADAAGLLDTWLVFAGIAVSAAAQMFGSPARSALVPRVVPVSLLLPAASTDTATQNIAAVAAPLLFAAIVAVGGLSSMFLTAAVLAVPGVLLPAFVRASGRAEVDHGGVSTLSQTWDGLRYVARHPILPGLFLLDTGITVASFYREILPVLALGLFAGGASATGMLGAANSAGAILGSFVALLLAGFRAKGMLVLYASLAYGLFLFGFGLANSLWLGMVMIGLLGAADAVTVAVRQTTVMLTTPDHMRGRAFSIMVLSAQTANNIGTIWVGAWAAAIGAGETMVLGGVIAIVATLLAGWLFRPIRSFRSD